MATDRERTEDGRFTTEHEIEASDILAAMPAGDPVGTGHVADQLDAPRRTVTYRLNKLADEGRITKTKLNKTTCAWTKPADQDQ